MAASGLGSLLTWSNVVQNLPSGSCGSVNGSKQRKALESLQVRVNQTCWRRRSQRRREEREDPERRRRGDGTLASVTGLSTERPPIDRGRPVSESEVQHTMPLQAASR